MDLSTFVKNEADINWPSEEDADRDVVLRSTNEVLSFSNYREDDCLRLGKNNNRGVLAQDDAITIQLGEDNEARDQYYQPNASQSKHKLMSIQRKLCPLRHWTNRMK